MKKKIMIIIILIILIFLIIGISLYFYSGGNVSDWSEDELIETIEDNVNARSQIAGNKLLVKRCVQQLNKKLADEDVDAEFYIENKKVYYCYAGDEKEMTIKKYIQNIKEEEKIEERLKRYDKNEYSY